MFIHGPSLGIGAGVTALVVVSIFFGMSISNNQQELVIEDVQIQEPKTESIELSIFTGNSSPILGDPNAPITLVEFGDYQCFFCNRHFQETEAKLIENYINTGKVKMIFKDFTIIGPDSTSAAHATHCANDQGKFWDYHHILYTNWGGENNGWASSEHLLEFAQEINLDTEQFTQCMLAKSHEAIIDASNQDARTLGLGGTPGFFIIGPNSDVTKLGGAQPYEVFERIFEEELTKT